MHCKVCYRIQQITSIFRGTQTNQSQYSILQNLCCLSGNQSPTKRSIAVKDNNNKNVLTSCWIAIAETVSGGGKILQQKRTLSVLFVVSRQTLRIVSSNSKDLN
ncbi:hypothetical protein CDAR_292411 [Caerostris darwini]|uniref:Uncharacterized protein n=1 Tax=Caerostris darwini TaxID=1538125 RepID=A0AAV4UD89_9ARAC|nr:hypothetical protein CDAR_292411 [Caerostris darwini]